MENTEHSNRKTILIAAAAIVVILIFLFLAILTINSGGNNTDSKDTQEAISDDTTSSNPQNDTKATGTPVSKNVPNGWKTYKNSRYSFNYPQEWNTLELNLAGGETGTSVQPIILAADKPAFIIAITNPASPSVIQQKQQFYTNLGFRKNIYPVDKIQAISLKGTIPPKSASVSAAVNVIQLNHVYLTRANNDYLLKYSYIGSEVDYSLETIFGKILSSFKFN